MTKRTMLAYGAVVLIIAAILAPVTLGESTRKPAAAGARCDKQHPAECRRAVAYWRHQSDEARLAVEWQKKHARSEVRYVLERVRGAQPFAYSARYAYAACLTFSDDAKRCRPPSEMLAVGRCESGLKLRNPNAVSSADGWLQYLSSTWAGQVVARLGWFSRYDAQAVALAGEGMSRRGWGAWRASISCHHLP